MNLVPRPTSDKFKNQAKIRKKIQNDFKLQQFKIALANNSIHFKWCLAVYCQIEVVLLFKAQLREVS